MKRNSEEIGKLEFIKNLRICQSDITKAARLLGKVKNIPYQQAYELCKSNTNKCAREISYKFCSKKVFSKRCIRSVNQAYDRYVFRNILD